MNAPLTTIAGCQHCRNESGFWVNGCFVPCEYCNPDEPCNRAEPNAAQSARGVGRGLPAARDRRHTVQRTQPRQPATPQYRLQRDTSTQADRTPAKLKLTKRQYQALAFIRDRIERSGTSPTRGEIATALGLSAPANAGSYLNALARKGHIELVARSPRGIRLL